MSTEAHTLWTRRHERDLPDGSVFRAVFEASRTVMFLIDPEAESILDANHAACEFYGYGPDEMECLEIGAVSLLPQLGIQRLLAELVHGQPERRASRHRLKNGELRDVQMDVEPIVLKSGRRCLFFIVHDITPLVQTQRVLNQREGLLRAILDSADDGIAFRDAHGAYREVNQAFCEIFGQNREELIGQPGDGRLDRRMRVVPVAKERRRDDVQKSATYEIRVGPAANERRLSVRRSPVYDAGGEYLGMVFVGRDMTELRKSEALLRAMLESAPDAIFITDMTDTVREANPAFLKWMGYARAKVVNRPFGDMFEGEDQNLELATNALAQKKRTPVRFTRRLKKRGPERLLNVVKSAILDPEGRCLGVVGFGHDITDQKKAEDALRRSERRLSSLIRQAPVGVFETDAKGRLTFANARMRRQTGRSKEELAGDRWLEAIHPDDLEKFLARWRQAIDRQQELDEEVRLLTPYGGVVWVSFRMRAMRGLSRQVGGYLGVLGDITDRKKAEAMRADVESVVRHDLKSPLASVQNAAELLELLGPLSAEQLQILGEVRILTRRMLGLIALSLDLHAMEAGAFTPQCEPIDLCAVLNDLRSELRPFIEGKGLALNVVSPCGDGPFYVFGERRLVDAVFSNLLKNAAEAAPENSEIRVVLRTEGKEAMAAVRNRGEVPHEIRGRFFEKYATFGKPHGTGLGTYSVRLMLRTLGGDVSLDTSESGATTLVVRLPLPPNPSDVETPPAAG